MSVRRWPWRRRRSRRVWSRCPPAIRRRWPLLACRRSAGAEHGAASTSGTPPATRSATATSSATSIESVSLAARRHAGDGAGVHRRREQAREAGRRTGRRRRDHRRLVHVRAARRGTCGSTPTAGGAPTTRRPSDRRKRGTYVPPTDGCLSLGAAAAVGVTPSVAVAAPGRRRRPGQWRPDGRRHHGGGELPLGRIGGGGGASDCSWELVDGPIGVPNLGVATWPYTEGGVTYHLWRRTCPAGVVFVQVAETTPQDLLPGCWSSCASRRCRSRCRCSSCSIRSSVGRTCGRRWTSGLAPTRGGRCRRRRRSVRCGRR